MPSDKRLHGLDFLRAAAILLVFFHHYSKQFAHPEFLEAVAEEWWIGVDLFFVLSGFLISTALFREWRDARSFSFRRFYIKRTFRIFPPYLSMVAIYFLWPAAREAETIAPLWKFLTFTQNIGLDQSTQRAFSHAWSLCMEEQFYLLFPAVTFLLLRRRIEKSFGWILLGLLVGAIASRVVTAHLLVRDVPSYVTWIYYAPHTHYDGLVFGVLVAWISVFRPGLWTRLASRWRSFGIVGAVMAAVLVYWNPLGSPMLYVLFYFPTISLAFALILISVVGGRWAVSSRPFRPIRFLADISYSGYLCHKIVINVTQTQGARLGIESAGVGMLLLCLLLTALCAYAMFRSIEVPSFSCRDKLLARVSPRRRAAGGAGDPR